MTEIVDTLLLLIQTALHSKKDRCRAIKEFQQIVWNEQIDVVDFPIKEIFVELAYDLDYYEPEDIKRQCDSSYYGNDRLEQELMGTLYKLREIGAIVTER